MDSYLSIREFYKGKNVFVTGSSGFMGKVLVEKLLYAIPGIGNVYLLMRPKRGRTVEQRLQDMLQSPIFNRIKNEKTEVLQKIIPIEGDVMSEDLDISNDDMQNLIQNVFIVFHLAATVNMDTSLKYSVTLNTLGTKRALEVAKRFKNLEMFVHVSTAFCHPDYEVLDEKFHRPSMSPSDVMTLCELLDEKQVALLTPSLLGQQPNTYTYTKRLSENLVYDASSHMPCVIARPSIVCPAFRDPMPGWVDNLNGPMGLLVAAGKGVIRTMLCDASLKVQSVPVDVAINGLIALVVIESSKKIKSQNLPIYNINVGHVNIITWGEVLTIAKTYGEKNPLALPLWYPNGGFTTNPIEHEIKRILFHLAPAYFIDLLLFITGQKRFLVRVQGKISLGIKLLQYFTTRQWHFPCPNFDAIHTMLTKEEDDIFVTYKEDVDKEKYITDGVEAGRVFILKEDPKKIPLNRIYFNFLYLLDTVVKFVFWCFVLSLLATWFEPIRSVLSYAAPVVKYLPFLGRTVLEHTD